MFREMGIIQPDLEEPLRAASIAYFRAAIPNGEYVGWIAAIPNGTQPVGGAGLLLGREGQLLNVYIHRGWRRPLYESMGFVTTREMSYTGRLASSGPWSGAV